MQQLITSLPQFKSQGVFSPQLFTQYVYASGLTQQQFIDEIKTQMLISQVANGIEFSSFVIPSDLKTYYDLLYQKRDFSYVTIPLEKFAGKVSISQDEEKSYYQNNQSRFSVPEQVSVAYIKLSPQQIGQTIKITDAELQQYYQNNLGNYRTPWSWAIGRITVPFPKNPTTAQVEVARKKMQAILTQLKQGKSFAELMKQNNGVSQTVSETEASSQLLNVLKKLKPQQVSEPVYTPAGYTLVRLDKVNKAHTKPFATVKDKIKAMLMNQKIQQKLQAMGDELTNLTYTNPDSLEEAARALKVQIQYSALFGRLGTKTGISASRAVVEAAFSEDVLQDGNNSNLITLKDGSMLVLRIKQHVASKVRPFKEVQDAIHKELVQQTERAQATLLAQQMQAELQKGTSLQQVASAQGLSVVSKQNVERTDKQVLPALLKAVFSLSLQKGKQSTVVDLPGQGSAIVMLNAVNLPSFAGVSAKEKQALATKLQQYVGGLTYELYVAGVKSNASIKYSAKQ